MTRREILTDDLEGETIESDVTRVTFGWAGVTYEIDLKAENRQALEDFIKPYVERARDVNRPRPVVKRAASPKASNPGQQREVRAWAIRQGIPVNPRGRISREIIAAFEERSESRAVGSKPPDSLVEAK